MTKGSLLAIVQNNKPPQKYVIDELAKKKGHEIICLTPYHCHFNPIELIWAEIKNSVAKKNTSFTIAAVQKLTEEAT